MSFVHAFVKGVSPTTLLLLHGTGGNERDLLGLGHDVKSDASFLSPLGKVREGSAPRFFRRLEEGVFDIEDLVFRTHELADWLTDAYAEYKIDPAKVIALGYSNGATVVSSLFMLRPESLAAGVALRPSLPFTPDAMPDLHGKQVLYLPGVVDPIVPFHQAEEVAKLMASAGADAEIVPIQAGHGLTPRDIDVASGFVQRLAMSH